MAALTEARIAALLGPYLQGPWGQAELPANVVGQFGVYLDLLLRWNARTNLTAVRAPEEVVRRHFGESIFAGLCLADCLVGYLAGRPTGFQARETAMLDVGSGAGFPGLPIQIIRPEWRVTLSESQGKKVSFLREVVRVLGVRAEVWPQRAEEMPPDLRFDAVTMRAVDRMDAMVQVGEARVRRGGALLRFATQEDPDGHVFPIPERESSYILVRTVE